MKYFDSVAQWDITVARKTAIQPFQLICKDTNGAVVDLTNWSVYAEVRKSSGSEVLIDMEPTITDAVNGVISFTNVDGAKTDIDSGTYYWDMVLEDATPKKLGVFIAGKFRVYDKITDSDVI